MLKVDVVNVAVPPERVPEPIEDPPSRKLTVPVGLQAPLTAALKVTLLPTIDGLGDEERVVVVARFIGAEFTVWFKLSELGSHAPFPA